MTAPPEPGSLAACLAGLAASAPLAQGVLDAGQGDAPGLALARLDIDFRWAVTRLTRQGGTLGAGLAGTPLNAALTVLHGRLADSAARVRLEILQAPVDPTHSNQGVRHA